MLKTPQQNNRFIMIHFNHKMNHKTTPFLLISKNKYYSNINKHINTANQITQQTNSKILNNTSCNYLINKFIKQIPPPHLKLRCLPTDRLHNDQYINIVKECTNSSSVTLCDVDNNPILYYEPCEFNEFGIKNVKFVKNNNYSPNLPSECNNLFSGITLPDSNNKFAVRSLLGSHDHPLIKVSNIRHIVEMILRFIGYIILGFLLIPGAGLIVAGYVYGNNTLE